MSRGVALPVVALLVLSGCGSLGVGSDATPSVVLEQGSVPDPYDGPMHVKQDFGDAAGVLDRAGAAGRALECDFEPYDGGGGDYTSGLESVQGTPEEALADWMASEFSGLPRSGWRLEREEDARALLSYDVVQRTRIAFVAADGIRDYNGDRGWGIESWAMCDPAELPSQVSADLGVQVWSDRSGAPVPVAEIRSFQGAEHCDWQDVTILELHRGGEVLQYLRDPTSVMGDFLRLPYDPHATVPPGAVDMGYHRNGRELWLGRDHEAAYLVSLDDPTDVERWPASSSRVACA